MDAGYLPVRATFHSLQHRCFRHWAYTVQREKELNLKVVCGRRYGSGVNIVIEQVLMMYVELYFGLLTRINNKGSVTMVTEIVRGYFRWRAVEPARKSTRANKTIKGQSPYWVGSATDSPTHIL